MFGFNSGVKEDEFQKRIRFPLEKIGTIAFCKGECRVDVGIGNWRAQLIDGSKPYPGDKVVIKDVNTSTLTLLVERLTA